MKFVGPEALVTANEVAFDTFVDSVRLGHWRSRPPPSPSREPAPQPTGQIRWELPKGWTESPPTSGMRVGEFRITDAPDVEVVLTRLQGNGGGVDWNVNRWREQMGAAVLSADEIGRLERMDVLGVKAVWVEIPGRYRGQAGEDIPDALFVGVICVLPTDSVFARLYGPRAGVERSRDAFRAFCRSLRLETGR